jgi:IS30 family transposase
MINGKSYLSIEEAARVLNKDPSTVWRYVKTNKFEDVIPPLPIQIAESEVIALKDAIAVYHGEKKPNKP